MDRSIGRRLGRVLGAAAVATGLGAALVGTAGPARAGDRYPAGTLATALSNFVLSPDAVTGANDWACEPSRKHPRPVVLAHGTFVNQGTNWAVLAPMLANDGYCVFAFNYGMTALSLGRLGGLGDITESAGALAAFVDRVLAATGAEKVDIVGHSQGGMLPSYYLKRLGGAAKVHGLVGLAPSNHGTTLSGLVDLADGAKLLGLVNLGFEVLNLRGLRQQEAGSEFQRALWADGDTVPGPRYTVIATKNDIVVTPFGNAFLKGADNIVIQDQCPEDPVGHIGMFHDSPTLQNVLNALGPRKNGFRAKCEDYGLPL